MGVLLLLVLAVLLLYLLPSRGPARTWGYIPSGVAGVALAGVVVLLVRGLVPWTF